MGKNSKKISLLPNMITAFGLSCGLFVIFKLSTVAPEEVNDKLFFLTSALMILAAFADVLDGAIARILNQESEFGGFFDSISDAITFGVAPSIIILKGLSTHNGLVHPFLMTTAAMIYSVCGVLRLVRFSVMAKAVMENKAQVDSFQKSFTGLPIPVAGAAIISTHLFLTCCQSQDYVGMNTAFNHWVLFTSLIGVGYLMVCRLRFPSLKQLHFQVSSFKLVFLTAICAVFFFYGIFYYFPLLFFVVTWAYITVSLVLSLVRFLFKSKFKALEDFEIEPDDL